MKVILTREVKSIGKADQIVNVSEGYARNFLFPRQLAVPADGVHMAEWEKRRKVEAQKGEKILQDAKALGEKINDKQVTVKGKVGQGSKLYGAITAADVADAIQKQLGVRVDKRKIDIPEPIKTLGSHDITIHLHHDVIARMQVEVVGE